MIWAHVSVRGCGCPAVRPKMDPYQGYRGDTGTSYMHVYCCVCVQAGGGGGGGGGGWTI